MITCQSSSEGTDGKPCAAVASVGMIVGTAKICAGVGGKCLSGNCETNPLPEGSPCGNATSCKADPDVNSCIDPDQPCVCDGMSRCEINYLPVDTGCDHELIDPRNDCDQRKCKVFTEYGAATRNGYEGGEVITCQAVDTNEELCSTKDSDSIIAFLKYILDGTTPLSCAGVSGICSNGNCDVVPLPEGSPCSDSTNLTQVFEACGAEPDVNPCIDPDQPCVCDGMSRCEINYLPVDTGCDHEEPALQCAERKCRELDGEITCQALDLAVGTPCSGEGDGYPIIPANCTTAGICDGYGVCDNLNCLVTPPPSPSPSPPPPSPPPPSPGDGPWMCPEGDGCTKSCGTGNDDCDIACEAQFGSNTACLGKKTCKCNCNIPEVTGRGQCNNFGGCPIGKKKKCCQCTTGAQETK